MITKEMTPEKHYNAAENQLDTIRLAVNSCELKERGDAFETLTLYCRKIPPVIPYFDSNVGRKWRLFHRTMQRNGTLPDWMGNQAFYASHRSALLFKLPDWYCRFGWKETAAVPNEKGSLPYVWPVQ